MAKPADNFSTIHATPKRNIIWDAWRIAKAYWTSEEKWSAWGLLVAIVTLNLGSVYASVRINDWNKNFYNALQAFNSSEVFRQLVIFCIIAAFAVTISVYAVYLNQTLQIRWRNWLTHKCVSSWLLPGVCGVALRRYRNLARHENWSAAGSLEC